MRMVELLRLNGGATGTPERGRSAGACLNGPRVAALKDAGRRLRPRALAGNCDGGRTKGGRKAARKGALGRAAAGCNHVPWPQPSRWRSLDAGIFIASRYFATVRRATVIPDCLSSAARRASDSGRRGSSCSIRRLSMAWMAVLDAVPPSVVDRLDEKKCLNSKVPRGVC